MGNCAHNKQCAHFDVNKISSLSGKLRSLFILMFHKRSLKRFKPIKIALHQIIRAAMNVKNSTENTSGAITLDPMNNRSRVCSVQG